jgi:DnaK suppressor protein
MHIGDTLLWGMLATGLLTTLQRAGQALHLTRMGTYGICEDCDSPISPARLRALPFARRCVACQEQYELFEHIIRREDREEI